MYWAVHLAIIAGLFVGSALIALTSEIRALRAERRVLEATRREFEARRERLEGQRASAMLEAMRLADAAERQRRAHTQELLDGLRVLLGQRDAAAQELAAELRRLRTAILVPLSSPRIPEVSESGIELRGEQYPTMPPPSPSPESK